MVAFYIVLRDETVILDSGFVQKVCCVGFLEQGIADVFFIAQDLVDGVRDIGDGVGNAVEDVGDAVGDVIDGDAETR